MHQKGQRQGVFSVRTGAHSRHLLSEISSECSPFWRTWQPEVRRGWSCGPQRLNSGEVLLALLMILCALPFMGWKVRHFTELPLGLFIFEKWNQQYRLISPKLQRHMTSCLLAILLYQRDFEHKCQKWNSFLPDRPFVVPLSPGIVLLSTLYEPGPASSALLQSSQSSSNSTCKYLLTLPSSRGLYCSQSPHFHPFLPKQWPRPATWSLTPLSPHSTTPKPQHLYKTSNDHVSSLVRRAPCFYCSQDTSPHSCAHTCIFTEAWPLLFTSLV